MGLLRLYLRKEIAELDREGIRIRFIGDRTLLEPDIALIEMSEQRTRGTLSSIDRRAQRPSGDHDGRPTAGARCHGRRNRSRYN